MRVLKLDEINVNDLEYSEPKTNAMGGQSIYITYKGDKLIFQTPKCNIPYGINEFQTKTGEVKHSLVLALKGNSKPMQTFKKILQELDDKNVEKALELSNSWFKKQLDPKLIDDIYSPTLKNNCIKAKMPTRNGEFVGEIFDGQKNASNMSIIESDCSSQAIIECMGMYFVAREFGLTWKVHQIKVSPPNKLQSYAFVDEDSDEDVEPIK